jgi:hypothetical protein
MSIVHPPNCKALLSDSPQMPGIIPHEALREVLVKEITGCLMSLIGFKVAHEGGILCMIQDLLHASARFWDIGDILLLRQVDFKAIYRREFLMGLEVGYAPKTLT